MCDLKELMTGKEVQEYLRISRTTLHKLTKDKRLPYIKLDRAVRFLREDVDKFIQDNRQL